jgi:CheY-like chemotaxis protein
MSLKVLTVDDSKTIRMIVKKAFKPFDCDLFEAENGIEGLSVAAREYPDLIVLDITMPVMNGVEMLGKLKSEPSLRDIPVIMLTAESGKDNVMQIVKMGVKDYMVKPFKGPQLIDRVKKIFTLEPRKEEEVSEDVSKKYFIPEGDLQRLVVPPKVSRPVTVEVEALLQGKLKEMGDAGTSKLILDLSKVTENNMSLIKLIILVIEGCQRRSIKTRVLGTPSLGDELKGFQETSDIPISHTMDEAKAAL